MSKVVEIQAEDWDREVMEADAPVVVDFWHRMCSWCLRLNPVYEQLPDRFEGVKFAKMDVMGNRENQKLAMGLGVMGTPTMKVFYGGRDIGGIVGFRTLDRLEKEIKDLLDKKEECLHQSTPLEG